MNKFANEYAEIWKMNEIKIKTEFITLDSFLKWAGVVSLGSTAQMFILDEMVKVNGEVCVQRGKKIRPGDVVEFEGESYKAVQE